MGTHIARRFRRADAVLAGLAAAGLLAACSGGFPTFDPFGAREHPQTSACTATAGCPAGDWCEVSTGKCQPRLANGAGCSADAQCTNGHCAQGVCCDGACGGACESCAEPDRLGACSPLAGGSAGTPSCAPYVCDGSSASCPGSCSRDGGCVAGDYCDGGSCSEKESNGKTCTAANQCQSSDCVDGYCCNTTCGHKCDACNVSGKLGKCTVVAQGSAGIPNCSPYVCNGTSATCPSSCDKGSDCGSGDLCTGGKCVGKEDNGGSCAAAGECKSGNCVDGYCCDTSCAGGCDACDVPDREGTCTVIAKGSPGDNPSCGHYVCDGVTASCPTTCAHGDGDCASGYFCYGGQCTLKPNGQTCAAGDVCASGNCVDGVCCDTPCAGGCDACDVPERAGTCTVIAQGSPGNNPSCSPYVCDGSTASCPTSCSKDTDCIDADYCKGITCVPKKSRGVSCTVADQCSTGNCVDGYCCNTSCANACDACNVSGKEGTCTDVPAGSAGSPSCSPYLCSGNSASCPTSCSKDTDCIGGDYCNGSACVSKTSTGVACSAPNQCSSGFCADGYCCNTACSGACDTCKVSGKEGTCTHLSAGSAGSPSCIPYLCSGNSASCPTSCGKDTDCIGGDFCSGTSCVAKEQDGLSCSTSDQCKSGFCVDGVCCHAACSDGPCETCSSNGSGCEPRPQGSAEPSCGGYLCDGSSASCPTACSSDSNCAAGYYCDGSGCVQKKSKGVTCSAADQCASGFCVDGVCCDKACSGQCDACNLSGESGTCTDVPAGTAESSCGAYLCNGSSASCPTTCATDQDCATGYACSAGGQCLDANGQSCSAGTDCASGHCAEGVCCNAGCRDGCDACNQQGFVGQCVALAAGNTGNPSCNPYLCNGKSMACPTSCTGDQNCASNDYCQIQPCACPGGTSCICPGICVAKKPDGKACAAAPSQCTCTAPDQCQSGNCADGYCCDAPCFANCKACDVSGSEGTCTMVPLPYAGNPSCAPYVCNGSPACPSSCTGDSDCVVGDTCDSSTPGQCVGPNNGAACKSASDCTSGYCVNGICCGQSCGPCQQCNPNSNPPYNECVDLPSGTVCRPRKCACEAPATCGSTSGGSTPDCPANAWASKGAPCDDQNPCTGGDACSGGDTCPGGNGTADVCAGVPPSLSKVTVDPTTISRSDSLTITLAGEGLDAPGIVLVEVCYPKMTSGAPNCYDENGYVTSRSSTSATLSLPGSETSDYKSCSNTLTVNLVMSAQCNGATISQSTTLTTRCAGGGQLCCVL